MGPCAPDSNPAGAVYFPAGQLKEFKQKNLPLNLITGSIFADFQDHQFRVIPDTVPLCEKIFQLRHNHLVTPGQPLLQAAQAQGTALFRPDI